MKESFAVEDEGQEALDEEAQRNLLLEFIGISDLFSHSAGKHAMWRQMNRGN